MQKRSLLFDGWFLCDYWTSDDCVAVITELKESTLSVQHRVWCLHFLFFILFSLC